MVEPFFLVPWIPLTLAELYVTVPTSFITFYKVLTEFIEDLTKPYHGFI